MFLQILEDLYFVANFHVVQNYRTETAQHFLSLN